MPVGNYYVYILGNQHNTVYYIGVTGDLPRRISEHKLQLVKGFTKKYNIDKLLYYEYFSQVTDAINREKVLKGWKRERKLTLIRESNPMFKDLSQELELI